MAKKTTKKTSSVPPDMEVLPKTERELKVELSPLQAKERMSRAIEIQSAVDDKTKEIDGLKEQSDQLKDEIKKLETEKDQICRGVMLVECEPVKNYEAKKIEYYYPNFAHGKKYDEVEFSADDHQRRMFQEKAESIPETGSDPFAGEMTQ